MHNAVFMEETKPEESIAENPLGKLLGETRPAFPGFQIPVLELRAAL
jgi:hypothetical protein